MISLSNYIDESIFDVDKNIKKLDRSIRKSVGDYLKANYKGTFKISKEPNEDGKFEVTAERDAEVKNRDIEYLTNGSFVFTAVGRDFDCRYCVKLKSLIGAPREVPRIFNCNGCKSLTSLEGAPEKVGFGFVCAFCKSLMSLEGAPEKVGFDFVCKNCGREFSQDEVKSICNVKSITC
jgi:hypothetical protein